MNEPVGWDPDPTLPPSAYRRMTFLLRAGLLLSLAIVLASLLVYLAQHPSIGSGSITGPNPTFQFLTGPGLISGLAAGDPSAFLTLGLLVLVATPIVRVVSGFYYFERGGERALAAITFTVAVLLLFGLLVLGPLVR